MPHPYTTTVHGLDTLIHQLRLVLPVRLTPDTLRTWDIGRSNESSLLATLRYLGVLDGDRYTLPPARVAFGASTDEEFSSRFAAMVRSAYEQLFAEHGEAAWTLPREALVAFMRRADGSGVRIADQQAMTFQALARHAGMRERTTRVRSRPGRERQAGRDEQRAAQAGELDAPPDPLANGDAVLNGVQPNGGDREQRSGKIEISINLPVTHDPRVYDGIFRSLREHLLAR